MEYLIFITKSAVEDFKRNKIRTILTSLGILIGVTSVVLLMAFGLGLKQYIKDQFTSLGTNQIYVISGNILRGGSFSNSPGSFFGARFDIKDVENLKRINGIEAVAPATFKSVKITTSGNTETSDLFSSSAEMFIVSNLKAEFGQVFSRGDTDKRSKVVVLGPKIAEKLFEDKQLAIGQIVKIDGVGFKVAGVLEAKGGGGFGGPDFDSFIYMPHTTGYIFNPDKKFVRIILKAESEEIIPEIKEEIKNLLLKRYKEEEFSVVEQTEILNAVASIFNIMNSVLVAIAAISLLVGGIGIMNIMYVSVVERVKEIGIRRAVGSTKKDILIQFLAEAVILSLIGGLFGLLLSFLVVFFIRRFFPAYIDLPSVTIALGVSSLIGVVFGVLPAKRASDLTPVEAIRYE